MKFFIIFLLIVFLPFCAGEKSKNNNDDTNKQIKEKKLNDGVYARLNTEKGIIIMSLFYKQAPLSVANFVGLAEGTIKNNEKDVGVPFYDGVLFHRVVNDFVIQTGDPQGDGEGGPGYSFPIEINHKLKHNTPGTLGMARDNNPDSNGSQFYITHRPTPHLDESYIVFGRVVKGMDVVNKIVKGDKLNNVKIIRIGKEAESYKVNDILFEKLRQLQLQKNMKQKQLNKTKVDLRIDQILSIIDRNELIKTDDGLKYLIIREGKGEKIQDGKTHKAKYISFSKDKSRIRSSYLKGVPYLFKFKSESLSKGLRLAYADMKKGEKRIVIIPPHLNKSQSKSKKEDPYQKPLIYELEVIL